MDRKDWLEWRRSGIGGSDAPVVAGVSPWVTRLELFLDKKGRLPEREPSERMIMGLRLEPVIAAHYAERTGETFTAEQEAVRSEHHPWMLATLDRRTASGRVVELKAAGIQTGAKLGEDGDADSLPDHWMIQAQHQMMVTKVASVTFAVLMPALELRIYEVSENQVIQDALLNLESDFWNSVERDEPPQDLHPQDAATLASAFRGSDGWCALSQQDAEAADQWVRLGVQIRELERDRESARARLLLSMRDAAEGFLPDGRVVTRKVIEIPERPTRAHVQVRLTVKESQ